MQKYEKFFIPYIPKDKKANINYIYLLFFYKLAESPEEHAIKQDISFLTYEELADRIGKRLVSANTLRRVVKNEEYKDYFDFIVFGDRKTIILKNDIRVNKKPFVVLCPNTYNLLLQQQDNLLAKYTIYLKYMCGKGGGRADFTANQFLATFGYATNSNNMKEKISQYNSLLEKKKIVSITRTPLEDGKRRNIYKFLDE